MMFIRLRLDSGGVRLVMLEKRTGIVRTFLMLLVPPCETSLAPFGKSLISTGHYFLRLAILNAPMFLMLEGVTIRVTRAGAFRVQNLSSWVEIGNGSSV